MGPGRPPKRRRNITGLRNQPREAATASAEAIDPDSHPPSPHNLDDESGDSQAELRMFFDSTRFIFAGDGDGFDTDSDVEEDFESEDWDSDELREKMVALAMDHGDDFSDEDWLPRELRRKKKKTGVDAACSTDPG